MRLQPRRAASIVGLARMLCADLPVTLHALAAGQISEWRATLIARETATLTPTGRRTVDSALSGRIGALGDRALARMLCADLPYAARPREWGAQ